MDTKKMTPADVRRRLEADGLAQYWTEFRINGDWWWAKATVRTHDGTHTVVAMNRADDWHVQIMRRNTDGNVALSSFYTLDDELTAVDTAYFELLTIVQTEADSGDFCARCMNLDHYCTC